MFIELTRASSGLRVSFNLDDIKRVHEPPFLGRPTVIVTSDCQHLEIMEDYDYIMRQIKLMQTTAIYVPPLKDVNARIVDAMEDITQKEVNDRADRFMGY